MTFFYNLISIYWVIIRCGFIWNFISRSDDSERQAYGFYWPSD